MKYFKHKTSIIDKGCKIGNGSKIWQWTHISKESLIGENCNLGQNVFVGENVKIGNNVKIQNNVSIYQGVEIEDNVFCGPSVVFTNVKYPIADKPVSKKKYEKTVIKKGSTLGANSTIICGVTIGKNSVIGAGAVVTKTVKNNSVVAGNPAKEIGKVHLGKINIYKKKTKLL